MASVDFTRGVEARRGAHRGMMEAGPRGKETRHKSPVGYKEREAGKAQRRQVQAQKEAKKVG